MEKFYPKSPDFRFDILAAYKLGNKVQNNQFQERSKKREERRRGIL
jgi:hypothetical protein